VPQSELFSLMGTKKGDSEDEDEDGDNLKLLALHNYLVHSDSNRWRLP
jgi:hypothetical protein